MGNKSSKETVHYDTICAPGIRSEYFVSSKDWRGLVFPVDLFYGYKYGFFFGKTRYVKDHEDKSQVDFNTGTITFVGEAYFII